MKLFQTIAKFFQDGDGSYSAQRLQFIFGMFFTFGMAVWEYHTHHDYAGVIALTAALSGIYGIQKLIQNNQEKPKD
jgi:hypothetical protein